MKVEIQHLFRSNKYKFSHLAKTYFGFNNHQLLSAYDDLKKDNYCLLRYKSKEATDLKHLLYSINLKYLKANYHKYKIK